MENATLHRPWTQAFPLALRACRALVVTRVRPILATGVAERLTIMATEQAAPVRPVSLGTTHPSPQRWAPARPGMRADAAMRLEHPYGSAARASLRQDAALHLR